MLRRDTCRLYEALMKYVAENAVTLAQVARTTRTSTAQLKGSAKGGRTAIRTF
jgi:hypothetical protein